MFHKILVALDYSNTSWYVLETAITLAKATKADLMLLHILTAHDEEYPSISEFPRVDTLPFSMYEEVMQRYAQQWQLFEQHNLQVLQAFAEETRNAGIKVDYAQYLGNPASEICQFAKTWQADLILMGRRGHRGIREFVLGSVSNFVMHHAPCSVLMVQGQTESGSETIVERQAVAV
ncbi:MAG: universal stress protein [Leptolyngbyaceae cyanobacterium RM1_406_9]|nr:universal stress protein [Leptolyngbyaceae cyanobacterium RM1_406_9]